MNPLILYSQTQFPSNNYVLNVNTAIEKMYDYFSCDPSLCYLLCGYISVQLQINILNTNDLKKRKKINKHCPHPKHQRPKMCFLLTVQMLQNCLNVICYIKMLNFPFYRDRTASNCLNLSKLLASAIKLLKFSAQSVKTLGPIIHLSDPLKPFRI